jgi:hypothetical protein
VGARPLQHQAASLDAGQIPAVARSAHHTERPHAPAFPHIRQEGLSLGRPTASAPLCCGLVPATLSFTTIPAISDDIEKLVGLAGHGSDDRITTWSAQEPTRPP